VRKDVFDSMSDEHKGRFWQSLAISRILSVRRRPLPQIGLQRQDHAAANNTVLTDAADPFSTNGSQPSGLSLEAPNVTTETVWTARVAGGAHDLCMGTVLGNAGHAASEENHLAFSSIS